jgi:hypothetical protein
MAVSARGVAMNTIYDTARYRFATAQLNWTTQKIVLIVWSGPPTFVATDTKITDIITRATTVAAGHSLQILKQTVSIDGYLQTDQVVVPSVPPGPTLTHFIMASFVTSWNDGFPILYVDDVMNLPFDPNGLDIIVQPDWLQQRGWGRV